MRDEAIKLISDETGDEQFKADDIQWVLTVPAIWTPRAKQFMREAAYEVSTSSTRRKEKMKNNNNSNLYNKKPKQINDKKKQQQQKKQKTNKNNKRKQVTIYADLANSKK